MIKQHLHYKLPDKLDVPLLRYLDIRKLKSLLQKRSLYFRRSDKFEDKLEGSYSDQTIANRPIFYKGAKESFISEGVARMNRAWAKCTYINCWYAGESESSAMWKLYGGCVAIKSSVSKLKNEIQYEGEFCLGFVRYIDYERDMISEWNAFEPFFHKHKAFQYEKEFRIMTMLGDKIAEVSRGDIEAPSGILVKANVVDLVDSIVISPYVTEKEEQEIKEILVEFKMSDKLKRSSLKRNPKF